jgi:uncharacterized membrane protein
MPAVALEWLNLILRWAHVIAAIMWIGDSFLFMWLDASLSRPTRKREGAVTGELWMVHSGGFYELVKRRYLAPEELPPKLHWFKWESYSTWISGFFLLGVVYYSAGGIYLVDRGVAAISYAVAVGLSLGLLAAGWVVYDALWTSPLARRPRIAALVSFALIVGLAFGLTRVFSGRAAFLHLGAVTATIMSANVFMVIIPNQKIVVADLIAGRKPDPKYGKIAKTRSTHNNYLTLPVLFLMLSNHYPLAFATEFNWIIASIVFIIGVLIRHFFNTIHARKGKPYWTWLVATILFIVIIWLSTVPKALTGESRVSSSAEVFVASAHFPAVRDTVLGRCAMCHAAEPSYEGIYFAPKGVVLETDAAIGENAKEIYLQAGRSHAMPPGNVTQISPQERALLVTWFEGAQ